MFRRTFRRCCWASSHTQMFFNALKRDGIDVETFIHNFQPFLHFVQVGFLLIPQWKMDELFSFPFLLWIPHKQQQQLRNSLRMHPGLNIDIVIKTREGGGQCGLLGGIWQYVEIEGSCLLLFVRLPGDQLRSSTWTRWMYTHDVCGSCPSICPSLGGTICP